jgi:phenylacetate-CoA ligase
LTSVPCACRRQLSRIKHIYGRLHDFILTTAGDLLAGEFFPHLFGFSRGVEQYQIVQNRAGELRVLLVTTRDFTRAEERWLVAKMKEYAGSDMDVVVEYVREIPRTAAGKQRVTISHLDPLLLTRSSRRVHTEL